VVAVGDELLLGETVDTNAAWLGRELAALGVAVSRHYTVGDVEGEIREAVALAMTRVDVVLVTGGLGPTRDDVTRDAVAALLDRELGEDGALLDALRARFRERGYGRLPEPNRSQAMVPSGARVLPNTAGTAPGLALEHEGVLVVLLPGVPHELKTIFSGPLRQLLLDRLEGRLVPVRHRTIHTSGVPESRLSELVEEVLPADVHPVSIAFLPDPLGVDLRLTVRGAAGDAAEARLDEVEALLGPVVAPWRFEAASGDLAEAVSRRLRALEATVAVAESCTGGLLAHRITMHPGAGDVFLGGVVAYANRIKVDVLGVPREAIERDGAVSEAVARAMALGVADRFGADAGIAITGVAGPDGGTEEKPVGTVWSCACFRGRVECVERRLHGDRVGIQWRSTQEALRLFGALVAGG